ncbi:MAG: nitrate reductase molybdenum cofactor assembly chaperone [Acidimicrobiales bacterium]
MKRSAVQTVCGCASVLLSYPDDRFADDLAAVAGALDRVPDGPARSRLGAAQRWLAAMPVIEAAARYVDTFDLRRQRTLHLTYYRHGDTRERGMALTALVDAYRGAGLRVQEGELPDFLPALLELAAVDSAGLAVLGEHRPALDALRSDLDAADSPYAGVVSAVAGVLGSASHADREALRRYRANGPPSEQVGLEPFAPPEIIKLGITRR